MPCLSMMYDFWMSLMHAYFFYSASYKVSFEPNLTSKLALGVMVVPHLYILM